MRAFTLILRHPTLRLISLVMALLGLHNASVYPYQSLIAIERIGLSEQAFSLMLVLASVAAVTTSVMFGVFSDQRGHRRRLAVITCLCSTAGIAMILLRPGPLTFWIGQGILLPMAWSIYGQLFTLARLASPDEGPGRENTRNAQLYVNLADNIRNDVEPFTVLGTVVEGMAVLDSLYSGYGEESGSGVRQGKQGPLERGGNAYMDREFPKLDRIVRVTIVGAKPARR